LKLTTELYVTEMRPRKKRYRSFNVILYEKLIRLWGPTGLFIWRSNFVLHLYNYK